MGPAMTIAVHLDIASGVIVPPIVPPILFCRSFVFLKRCGDRIDAAEGPWMTTQKTFSSELCPLNHAKMFDGFVGVLRAGWVKFATRLCGQHAERAVIQGEGVLIDAYQNENDAF